MSTRTYVLGIVITALLLFGPIPSFPIRIAYVVLIPVAVWLALKFVWWRWRPSADAEARMNRALSGLVSGILLALAFDAAKEPFHVLGETEFVEPGPNRATVAALVAAACFFFWLGARSWGDE